ncbi:MAG: HAD family hydrolase [Rubrobacteraceae bacterium]
MLQAALFDFDGTLVDTTDLIYQGLRYAVRKVLDEEPERDVLMAGVGQPLPQQMAMLTGGRSGHERLDDELLETYFGYQKEHHEELIRQFPGVEGSLTRLRDAGVMLAVVTSKRRPSVDMALDTFPGLGEVVNKFVTMEDTTEHKPHPAPLLKGLELLGNVPKEEAAYIGDSPHDVAAARAAGLSCVAVSWGAFSEKSLRDAEPDYLVPDLHSAVDVLLKMAGPDS